MPGRPDQKQVYTDPSWPHPPIYTDDIACSVPDAPLIPTDLEEIGTRLVMAELELLRLKTLIEILLPAGVMI